VIADMTDIIFEGRVDESEVGKISKKMKLAIKVGAIEDKSLEGELEYISPKGKEIDGAIQFEIKAKVTIPKDVTIRAKYSANADIKLAERTNVLAIREALVQYKDGKPFVEIETESEPQRFVTRDVKLGISDGIKVEILDGVAKGDRIKIPDNAGPAKAEGSGAGSAKPPQRK
jgi:HlyD family secretion protein